MNTPDLYRTRHKNLRQLMDELGGQKALVEASGKGQAQISQLVKLTNYKRMGEKLAREIERKCGKPMGWLDEDFSGPLYSGLATDNLYGLDEDPPMFSLSKNADRVGEEVPPGDNYINTKKRIRRVPVISQIQAGSWSEIVDNFEPGDADEWQETTADLGPHGFALIVVGDSMYNQHHDKSIPPGATVYVHPGLEAQNGDIVVARTNGNLEATVKQLVIDGPHTYLNPLNPNYKPIVADNDCEIVGVVREWGKKFR